MKSWFLSAARVESTEQQRAACQSVSECNCEVDIQRAEMNSTWCSKLPSVLATQIMCFPQTRHYFTLIPPFQDMRLQRTIWIHCQMIRFSGYCRWKNEGELKRWLLNIFVLWSMWSIFTGFTIVTKEWFETRHVK